MSTPNTKLYGPKQIIILIVAGLAGIGFFLFRRYYETGKLGRVELIAMLFTVLVFATIGVYIVRKGNRED